MTIQNQILGRIRSHQPALDGLRGLAVLLVFFHHSIAAASVDASWWLEKLLSKLIASGWIGVDIFFALSGFLITGILLDTRGKQGYFTGFYAKRCLRIFPLYFLFLFLVFVALKTTLQSIYNDGAEFSNIVAAQGWFWTYFQNWYFVGLGHGSPIPVTQLWSLAVEEQFYLVWPLVIFFCSARKTFWISTALCFATPFLRFALISDGWSETQIYMSTVTRADSLLLGAMVAAYFRTGYPLPTYKQSYVFAAAIVLIGIATIVGVDHGLKRGGVALQTIGFSLIAAVTSVAIYICSIQGMNGIAAKILSNGILRSTGKYSYAIYIFHPPILYGVASLFRDELHLLSRGHPLLSFDFTLYLATTLGITSAVSLVTWNLFERRFLALKKYFQQPQIGGSHIAAAEVERAS